VTRRTPLSGAPSRSSPARGIPSAGGAARPAPARPASARGPRSGRAPAAAAAAAAKAVVGTSTLAERLAMPLLWLLVLVTPLYIAPSAKDCFRLPKLLLAEWLALASLVPLAWALRRVETVRWRDLWRLPAVRAALPLAAVATAGLATSVHPLHVREGLTDLWIGAACLVGWSAALPAARLERLLGGLLWPAAAMAALGILQFHGLRPLAVVGVHGAARLAITSTAGNPGDLAAFLVLPCLFAQWRLARGAGAPRPAPGPLAAAGRAASGRGHRWGWLVAALVLYAYALAVTQTVAALAALILGSVTLWAGARYKEALGVRRLAAVAGVLAVLVAAAVAGVPALRARMVEKVSQARQGHWNVVLTGRLDGWRTALWMLGEHPWTGVGQGAYRAEFVPAKLALLDRGVAFVSGEQQNFANAHDEALEVGADLGVPGLLALAWGLAVVVLAARARGAQAPRAARGAHPVDGGDGRPQGGEPGGRADRAFAAAGLVAFGMLCLVDFPFRGALVAFPALLFLAWVLRPATAEAAA